MTSEGRTQAGSTGLEMDDKDKTRCGCVGPTGKRCELRASQEDGLCDLCRAHCEDDHA